MRVSVFGLGYVGAVTAGCLAKRGHWVVGVDVNPRKVRMLDDGEPPILEPGLEALLRQAKSQGLLQATPDCAAAVAQTQVSVVCVGTPSLESGELDLGSVRQVAADIAAAVRRLDRPHALVLRSTVLPGTTARLVQEFLSAEERGGRAPVYYYPEFTREGTAVADFEAPSLAVVGTRPGRPVDPQLMEAVFGAGAAVVDWGTAEMVKHACNAFHATKAAFANETGRLAKQMGVDAQRVMALLCQDTKLNISPYYLRPGNPFGGACLPKDVRALVNYAQRTGAAAPLLRGVMESNQRHLESLLALVERGGWRQVAILGLSFKAGTDDLRESAMVEAASALAARGVEVRLYDPAVSPEALVGSNRRVLESKLPLIATMLKATLAEALDPPGLWIVAQPCAPLAQLARHARPGHAVLDVNGWPGLRSLPVPYEGFCW